MVEYGLAIEASPASSTGDLYCIESDTCTVLFLGHGLFTLFVSAEGVSTRRVRAPRRELIGINSTMGLPPVVGGPRETSISTKHSDFRAIPTARTLASFDPI